MMTKSNSLSALYLALFTFGLCPRLVKGYELTLFEPPSLFESPETTFTKMMRRHQEIFDSAFFRDFTPVEPSPPCEVINDDAHFELSLHLPAGIVTPKVDFNEQTRLLTISGEQETTTSGYHSMSQFSRSYTLDHSVQVDQITAALNEERVLTVSAPKDPEKVHHFLRHIPVQQKKHKQLESPPKVEAVEAVVAAKSEPIKEEEGKEDDPFHVKEHVAKAQQHERTEEDKDLNERLENAANSNRGFHASEFRRLRH